MRSSGSAARTFGARRCRVVVGQVPDTVGPACGRRCLSVKAGARPLSQHTRSPANTAQLSQSKGRRWRTRNHGGACLGVARPLSCARARVNATLLGRSRWSLGTWGFLHDAGQGGDCRHASARGAGLGISLQDEGEDRFSPRANAQTDTPGHPRRDTGKGAPARGWCQPDDTARRPRRPRSPPTMHTRAAFGGSGLHLCSSRSPCTAGPAGTAWTCRGLPLR